MGIPAMRRDHSSGAGLWTLVALLSTATVRGVSLAADSDNGFLPRAAEGRVGEGLMVFWNREAVPAAAVRSLPERSRTSPGFQVLMSSRVTVFRSTFFAVWTSYSSFGQASSGGGATMTGPEPSSLKCR